MHNDPVGKPKSRWTETVEEDCRKILGIRNWKREAIDRQEWRDYPQESKARCRVVTP
jgi:hypothetical protein